MVKRSSGFEWRPERPNATTFVEQKWGWTGQAVGESASQPASSSSLGHLGACACASLCVCDLVFIALQASRSSSQVSIACLRTSLLPSNLHPHPPSCCPTYPPHHHAYHTATPSHPPPHPCQATGLSWSWTLGLTARASAQTRMASGSRPTSGSATCAATRCACMWRGLLVVRGWGSLRGALGRT
jgi:hypothetical protein